MRKPKSLAPGSMTPRRHRLTPSASSPVQSCRFPTRDFPARLATAKVLTAAVALATLLAAVLSPGLTTGGAATAATIQMLLVGDSITVGDPLAPGFRNHLHGFLNDGGDVYEFVGLSGTAPLNGHFLGGGKIADFYPPSHGGNGTFSVVGSMDPPGGATAPQLVVVHLGTNNLNSDPSPYVPYSFNHGQTMQSTAAGELGELHKYLLRWANGMESFDLEAIVLSLIVPIGGRLTDVEDWNNALIDLSEDFSEGVATGSQLSVTLADHYSHFMDNPFLFTGGPGDWMTTGDDLHPNAAGYEQMAGVYRDAIEQTVNDATPPAAVTDLITSATSSETIQVTFSATGDDAYSGNAAARYDLRYATSPINAVNFGLATQVVGEPSPRSPGVVESLEIGGLLSGTTYYVAVKVVDDGGNRSSISNVELVTTAGAGGDIVDDFNRAGPDLGFNWNEDPEYRISGFELTNTSFDQNRIDFIATFVGLSNPLGAGFRWSPSSNAAGRNQAGLALRLDAPSPDASGYLLYRDDPDNGWPNQWNISTIIAGDLTGAPIVSQASNMPTVPAGNDEIRVLLSSDAAGHHFDILINGAFDVRITDPARTTGNSAVWYVGYMSRGGMSNNIDDYTLVTDPGQNLPPGAFDLQQPPDGTTLSSTTPFFDWTDSFDPDPGDQVTYTLSLSQEPGFPPSQTTSVGDLTQSQYTWTAFLQRDATYYWKVEAEDVAGASVSSNQTWTFTVPNLLSIIDDFERPELGGDWVADGALWGIDSGEMANVDPSSGFSLAVYGARSNPTAVGFRMGVDADSTGFNAKAGFAVMLDAASTTPNGYMVYRNWAPYFNWQLAQLVNGNPDVLGPPGRADATLLPPAAGDEVRVVLSSDENGHHFDIYVRGEFDARITDDEKREGNGPTLYAGYVAWGENAPNNIDDFTLTGVDFNSPPAPFDLVAPPDETLVFTLAPILEWEEAIDPNPDDQVTYRVRYDTDPAFTSPDSLPSTTELSIPFTGPLLFGESYYWQVRADDIAGASAFSNQTWSFSMADTLSVVDDFDRPGPSLGDNWLGDSGMVIAQVGGDGELSNSDTGGSLSIAAYASSSNPDAVSFHWGTNATSIGIQRGSMALMLSTASSTPDGYMVTVDPTTNKAKLETINDGAAGVRITDVTGVTGAPGAGALFGVSMTSDVSGHHFDVYINGNFHARLTDPLKREGNEQILYAGVALRGDLQNNIDDFTMTAFNFGPPPEDFSLLAPAHGAIDVPISPELSWEAAGGAGMIYVVYAGTDSSFTGGAVDSVNVQGATSVVWPTPLAADTDFVWRVRATDGQQSRLNLLGWHHFRTTATPVELVRFEVAGEEEQIRLLWETGRELDHLGFHVWRSDETAPGDYRRLTERMVERVDDRRPVYRFLDEEVDAGTRYAYRLEAVDLTGGSEFFGPLSATPLARVWRLRLARNVPNPFNPSTEIHFELPAKGSMTLAVFNVQGRLIRELADGTRDAGVHVVRWDGRDQAGREVASGIYFSRLQADGRVLTRKMMLVR